MSGVIPKRIWTNTTNLDLVEVANYIIDINGATISKLHPDTLWGSGLSLYTGNFAMQIIITNNLNAVRY